MLGYNKAFPSTLVGFWGSGTGAAGPFASGLYILLTAAEISDLYVFINHNLQIRYLLLDLYCSVWYINVCLDSSDDTGRIDGRSGLCKCYVYDSFKWIS
jgi:hypothetical protein